MATRTRFVAIALILACVAAAWTLEGGSVPMATSEPVPVPAALPPPASLSVPHTISVIVGGPTTPVPSEQELLRRKTSGDWCALPRPDEPLLADAVAATRGYGNPEAFYAGYFSGNATVAVVFDEPTCRRLSELVTGLVEPVLVVRAGDLYLVDTQLPRDGDYWQVDTFNLRLEPISFGYGDGA